MLACSLPLPVNSSLLGNEFYYAYKNAGFNPELVLMALLIACCAIPGNVMNLFLVYLTVRHKSLRGTSNYLLALNSLLEFLHQTGHYIFLYTILSGQNFIPFMCSVLLQMQAIFGYNAAIFTMLETAIDRFLCVLMPEVHTKLGGPVYLAIHTLMAAIPGIYLSILVMDYAVAYPNEPVTGQLSDTCSPVNLIYNYNMVICIGTFLLYALIGALVYRKGQNTSRNRRLFKSLSAIMLIMVGSYFLNTILRKLAADVLHFGPINLWFLNVAGGVLVNIGAAANVPILYSFSSEYRKRIDEELKGFFVFWQSQFQSHSLQNLSNSGGTHQQQQQQNAITLRHITSRIQPIAAARGRNVSATVA